MRLRYAINVTIDGCVHHEAGLPPDEESMAFWTDEVASARALLCGRRTYELMESAWRRPATGHPAVRAAPTSHPMPRGPSRSIRWASTSRRR
mgnify:CR=1 FL=1